MSLKNVHTRKLLDVLRTVRSRQSLVITQYHERTKGDEAWERSDDELTIRPEVFGFMQTDEPVTVAQLKAELATREHVPSKLEGHLTRRRAAQRGRSRGRKDR